MLSRGFLPFQKIANWYGVNSKDSNENMLDGEFDKESINIRSHPRGGVSSRLGYTAITSSSIGSVTAWCGIYQYRKKNAVDHLIAGGSDGKLYKYASNTYTELESGFGTGIDTRYSFGQLNDLCVIVEENKATFKWNGTGSATTLGGTLVTADWGLEWQRYYWLHSVADKRLVYYCTDQDDPESGYTSFLNFDRNPGDVIGGIKQGDDLLIAKQFSLFRVQFTGADPLFPIYQIPSKIGFVSHWAAQETQDGRVLFLGPNKQVYMITGDVVTPVGDNIVDFLENTDKTRREYAVAGINHDTSEFWLSFTDVNGSNNDRIAVMQYDRPYTDKFGKLQFPWFIYQYTDGANAFAQVFTAGKTWLYHGGYTGKIYKDDTGTNDDGAAFRSFYKSKRFTEGDITAELKYSKLMLNFENQGSHNLNISAVVDNNAATEKVIIQSMLGGSGSASLWDVAKWDEDNWSGESDVDVGRDIDRVGKNIYITMGTTGLNESWSIFDYTILAKPLRRSTVRSRES